MATSSQYGAFVTTTFVVQISQIQSSTELSSEEKRFFVDLYQNLNSMANVINVKQTGQYPLMETVDGALWFPNPNNNSSTAATATQRQELRSTYLSGPLKNAGILKIPHGITVTANTSWTFIGGTATNPAAVFPAVSGYPIPNVDAANPISINVDSMNINITTTTNLTAFTIVYVVLQYLQS